MNIINFYSLKNVPSLFFLVCQRLFLFTAPHITIKHVTVIMHAWWMEGLNKKQCVHQVVHVFTGTKIQTFPWTMFCRTSINMSEALTGSIKPTGGIFTFLSLKFSIFLPLHKLKKQTEQLYRRLQNVCKKGPSSRMLVWLQHENDCFDNPTTYLPYMDGKAMFNVCSPTW